MLDTPRIQRPSRRPSWLLSRSPCLLPPQVRFYGPRNIQQSDADLLEIDHVWPLEHRHKAEGILAKTGQPYQLTVYGGVVHGFAVRGDLSDAKLKTAKELAFLQALQWFQYHL